MGNELSTAVPYQGPSNISYTSVDEAKAGAGAEGQQAPAGTTPVPVDPNDTISGLMAQANPPLDWNNPAHREQFLADNPQFGDRDPNLIYPGEVLYIRNAPVDANNDGVPDTPPDANGDGIADPATDTNNDGRPDPLNAEQAAATTDAAAQDVAEAEQAQDAYMRTPGPKGLRHEYEDAVTGAQQRLNAALQAEVELGLQEYQRTNPDATPDEVRTEADRLANEAQGRSGAATDVSEATIDAITQRAINNVSAGSQQPPIDLDRVATGTTVRDGPYSPTYGPFEPNSTITLKDGSTVSIGANGYPVTGSNPGALAPPAANPQAAQSATTEATQAYERSLDIPSGIPESEQIQQQRREELTSAVQREVELQLQTWLEQNPGATEQEITDQATAIAGQIQQREGANVVSEAVAGSAATQAASVVIADRYN